MLWRKAFAEYNFFATEAQRKQRMKPLNKLFSVFFSASVAIFFDKFDRKWSNCRKEYILNHYQARSTHFDLADIDFTKRQYLSFVLWKQVFYQLRFNKVAYFYKDLSFPKPPPENLFSKTVQLHQHNIESMTIAIWQ